MSAVASLMPARPAQPPAVAQREQPAPVIELEPCPDPRCACRGFGSVTLMAASSRALLEAHARPLATGGACLLTRKGSRSPDPAPKSGAPGSSAFYRGHLLCSLEAAPAGSVLAATAMLDLPTLRRSSLSVRASSEDQLLLLYQPATLNPVERQMQETLPGGLQDSPETLLSRKGVLLLLQPGGWALGDFLAKAALLRQRERWRTQTAVVPNTSPESVSNSGS